MKTTVAYLRVSTEDQDYNSQLSDLRNYASKNGLKIVKEFGEKVSGFDLTKERTEFEAMKEFCFTNSINVVLVWELSRFGRSALRTLNEIKEFSDHKVDIYFFKDNLHSLDGSDTNKLLLHILSVVAEMERNSIKDRMVRGRKFSVSNGVNVGNVPFGFKSENKKLVINEDEALWVRRMFEWRKQGKSFEGISHELNKNGIKTRYAEKGHKRTLPNGKIVDLIWHRSSVQRILESELYKGIRMYSGEVHTIPQIISNELWDSVQVNKVKKIGLHSDTKFKYDFKGKLICGDCNRIIKTCSDNRSKTRKSYYRCNGKEDKQITCNLGSFNSFTLDKYLWIMLAKQSQFREELFKLRESEINEDEIKNQIEYLDKLINEANKKRRRTIETYQDGYLDRDQYLKGVEKINNDIKQWELEINECKSKIERQKDDLTSLKKMKEFNIRQYLNKRPYIERWCDKVLVYRHTDKVEGINNWEVVWKVELYSFGLKQPKKAIISSMTENFIEL